MVIICPVGMEHRLALTLLPMCTHVYALHFWTLLQSGILCSSHIVHSATFVWYYTVLLVNNVLLNIVCCSVQKYVWMFYSPKAAGFSGLSDFGSCFLILFYCSFYVSGLESAIQNSELGISIPHKMNEKSELFQSGPHGSEHPEQRDSWLVGNDFNSTPPSAELKCLTVRHSKVFPWNLSWNKVLMSFSWKLSWRSFLSLKP